MGGASAAGPSNTTVAGRAPTRESEIARLKEEADVANQRLRDALNATETEKQDKARLSAEAREAERKAKLQTAQDAKDKAAESRRLADAEAKQRRDAQLAARREDADRKRQEMLVRAKQEEEARRGAERVNDFAAHGGINLVCGVGWYSGCLNPSVG